MGKKGDKKTNAMRQLVEAGVAYDTMAYSCDGEVFDGRLVARQVGMPPSQVFKTLVSREPGGQVVVCCIPVEGRLDLKALAAASGHKRLEMLPPAQLQGLTGYIRGGVSPIGMKKPYPVFLDESAFLFEKIAISAGTRGLQLLLSPRELASFAKAVTGPFSRREEG